MSSSRHRDRSLDGTLTCAGAVLNVNRRIVMLRSFPVVLSPLECRAVETLFLAEGRLVSSDAFIQAIWPDGACNAMNLRALIGRLRQKLGPECIETIGREGYRWVGREGVEAANARRRRDQD